MDEWQKRLLHSRLLIEYTLLLSRLLPTDLLKSNGTIKHIIKVLYILRNSWIQKGEWNNVRSLWLSAPDYVFNIVFDLYALSLSYLVVVAPPRNGWFVVFLRFICISPQSNCQICQHRLIQKVAITVQLQFFLTPLFHFQPVLPKVWWSAFPTLNRFFQASDILQASYSVSWYWL